MNGATFSGELVSIGADGLTTFRTSGDSKDGKKGGSVRTIALKELVRWGNPAAPKAQTIVALMDGGRIMTAADWAGGATLRLAGSELIVVSNLWDEVRLPRGLIGGIVFASQRRAEDREMLLAKLRDEATSAEPADVVALANGDRLTGKLTELDRGSLAIETRSGTVKVPLSRVEAIVFATARPRAGNEEPARETKKLAIGGRDGSLLYATAIHGDEKGCEFELSNRVKLKGGSTEDLTAIQVLGGPIAYLSDLEGADYRSVPYLSVKWPFTRDRNVLGEPIVVRGKRYIKGIGMHSAARLTYRLDGDYRRFDSSIAIDDSAKGRGSVTFGVYLQGDGKWGEAFQSGIIRGDDEPQPISIDLHGAKGITLTVDFADRGDELDHAVWLDARLVK